MASWHRRTSGPALCAAALAACALACSPPRTERGEPHVAGALHVEPPRPAPAAPTAEVSGSGGLRRLHALEPLGPRFLREARAIVYDEGDEGLRILADGRTDSFPELGWHSASEGEPMPMDQTRLIAFAGAWSNHAVGARIRFFFNGQTVVLVQPVAWRDGRWVGGQLIESFVGLGKWPGGCVITPSMSDVDPIFELPDDPNFRPHFVVLGCANAVDLPNLPGGGRKWDDAFGSTEARHAVLVGRQHDDVVIHHWVAGQRDARRHELPGLTVDSRLWKQLENEKWLADERNPIVWRSPTEPVVFLRLRDTSEPIEDDLFPAPALDSVIAVPDGATWRTSVVPGVQLERFAAGPDGAIWMTGGGRLWRMTSLDVVESVELPRADAGDLPTVPIDVLPIAPRTLWLIAQHGPEARREISLFRYDAADPLGPRVVLRRR